MKEDKYFKLTIAIYIWDIIGIYIINATVIQYIYTQIIDVSNNSSLLLMLTIFVALKATEEPEKMYNRIIYNGLLISGAVSM